MNEETVTWLVASAGAANIYGDPVLTWTPSTSWQATIWPKGSDETVAVDRDSTVARLTVALPLDAAAVGTRDRFTARDQTWSVIGTPALYHWRGRDLVVVDLARVEG